MKTQKVKLKNIQITELNPKLNRTNLIINKILLLRKTNNIVCSYDEDAEVEIFKFSQNISNKINKNNTDKTNIINNSYPIQTIIDPHGYSIEYLLETKSTAMSENYLLLCSDMIHIFLLYENDTKHKLIQTLNEFNFRYIYQVIELKDGDLISYSNEYKISVFQNLIVNKKNFYENEIYELTEDKLNKNNEVVLNLLELNSPNKFVYCYRIDDGEFTLYNEIENDESSNNLNKNDSNYMYLTFFDENYEITHEMKMCNISSDFHNMFQYKENLMVFCYDTFMKVIDVNSYQIISVIETDLVNFSFLINDFDLLMFYEKENEIKNDEENSSNNSMEISDNLEINDEEMSSNDSVDNNDDSNNVINDEQKNEFYISFYSIKKLKNGIKKVDLIDEDGKKITKLSNSDIAKIMDVSFVCDKNNQNSIIVSVLNSNADIYFYKLNLNNSS